jgi:L-rhamnose mutarotase
MNTQLQHAFDEAAKLPAAEQNILAEALSATVRNYELFADDEAHWDALFDTQASQQWLEKMAAQVEEEIGTDQVLDFDPALYVLQK